MKQLLAFTLFSFFAFVSYSQSIVGKWQGSLKLSTGNLPLIVALSQTPDNKLNALLISPTQSNTTMSADSVYANQELIYFALNRLNANYKGHIQKDSIDGIFSQNGQSFPLILKRLEGENVTAVANRPQTPKPPFNYLSEDLSIKNENQGNTLAGTLTTPKNKKNFPVAIIISGSGTQDRDGTLFGHKLYWVIADYLSNHGIGVLRLDDRGIGNSDAGSPGATSADFATDIGSAVNFLASKGFQRIGLIGHSEGGMIAPMVAMRNPKVNFIVSLAGPGVPIDTLMKKQLAEALRLANVPAAAGDLNKAIVNEAYHFNNNYTSNDLAKDLETDLMNKFPLAAQMNKAVASQIATPWFSYFVKQNPQANIEKLKIPVLAMNGNKDFQVDAEQNLNGWKTSLQKAGNRNFKIVNLPNLNHLFQTANTGAVSEYGNIEETIAPVALETMTQWILQTAR